MTNIVTVQYHIVISDGVWFPDGSYYELGHWDQASLLGRWSPIGKVRVTG